LTTPHVFKTKTGRILTFPSQEAMEAFAKDYALGTLLAEGKMKYVTVDGKRTLRITNKGIADFKHIAGIKTH